MVEGGDLPSGYIPGSKSAQDTRFQGLQAAVGKSAAVAAPGLMEKILMFPGGRQLQTVQARPPPEEGGVVGFSIE
jgi:hypothetical protein